MRCGFDQIVLLLGCWSLLPFVVVGQATVQDSLLLDEVLVKDYILHAGADFREDSYDTDSLILGRASLAETLRKNSTVFVRSYGSNGVATLSMRGTSGYHTNLYWNNLDLGSPMLGLADLSTIPAASSDEINVQYGFASLNDGTGGIGGSIRLNNNYSALEDQLSEVSIYAGSFGQWQGKALLNYKAEKFAVQVGGLRYTAKNNFSFPDITESGNPERTMTHAQFDQESYWANAYYHINKKELLSLKTWYNKVSRDLPPNLTGNQQVYDQLRDEGLMSVLEYQRIGNNSRLLISSGLVAADNDFTSGGDSISYLNTYVSWQNSLRYEYHFNQKLSVESGGRFRMEEAKSRSYEEAARRNQGSVFTNWGYQIFSALKLNVLLREEWIEGQASPLLGSVGMVYDINQQQSTRLNLARNYRFPSLNDFHWTPGGNPDLLAEGSYNLEWGYNFHASKWPDIEVSVFHNLIDNWIQWSLDGSVWSPQNIKKVANTGIELGVKDQHQLGPLNVAWRINYSYTRSRTIEYYSGNTDGLYNQLPYVPFHLLNTGIDLRYKKLILRYQQNVNGVFFTNSDNSIYMPGFTLGYITLGMSNILESKKHVIGVNFELNNLFDYDYQILPYRPESGFSVGLRLTYSIAR